jgi:hypothetical protein
VIDPVLALALSLQSNPGVYALLLGSGISRSSGVPTGWEIVEAIIRKLAMLRSEDCGSDPIGWYRGAYSREPDYSEILNEVARSPAERMQFLRSFFEPTEEERQEGRKLPTNAHRLIGDLVAAGYVHVIITTNFDRLLEASLVDVGVQASVISSADAASGALPIAHSRCTIIKVNGDYLDSRLRNTSDELASYERPIERLLDQVFDEYGLIVCGWSGDWDTALRSAIERCSMRRFTTYWASRGQLSEKAQDLVNLRKAVLIQITGADDFFRDLRAKVFALADMTTTDVLSAKVAVARMKKYLADPAQRISLHDLLSTETEKAYAAIIGPSLPFNITRVPPSEIKQRIMRYSGALDTILSLMICGGYWGEQRHETLLLSCYKRLADQAATQSSSVVSLARFPALYLLYGMGLAAVARQNYRFLRLLFNLKIKHRSDKPEGSVASVIHDQLVLRREDQKVSLSDSYIPMSDYIFVTLRDKLRDYIPSDSDYDRMFDWFEYLLCLCHCDAQVSRSDLETEKAKSPDFTLWASVGRFVLKSRYDGQPDILAETTLRENQRYSEVVTAVLKAGFFESAGQHDDKYLDVKAAFDRHVMNVRRELMVF